MGNQGFQGEVPAPSSVSRRVRKGIKLLSPSLRNQTSESQRERASHMASPAGDCATGRALRSSTAKLTACAAGCELVLHNGNVLGKTASDCWRTDTATFLAQNGLAATALRCFPTESTFGTRATTVCGGLGRSVRARPRRYIWCVFWTTRGRSSFLFLRRATRLRQEWHDVLGVYKYTSLLARLHRGSNVT